MMFKQTRVRARRIRKVMKAILTNPPDDMEIRKEMEADLKRLNTLSYDRVEKEINTCGDNHSFELGIHYEEFEELEVKYVKAPKEALKQL